jgi:hypothetical protein
MRRTQWNKTQRREFLLRASVTITALGGAVTPASFLHSFILPTPFGALYLEPENSKFASQILGRFAEPQNGLGYVINQDGTPYQSDIGTWSWWWIHSLHTPETATVALAAALRDLLATPPGIHVEIEEPETQAREAPPWLAVVSGPAEETKT